MSAIQLKENEIRVMRLKREEIDEFVWILFRTPCRSILDVPDDQDDVALGIRWDHEDDSLEAYAMLLSAIHMNFKEINFFLGHMTDSAFLPSLLNTSEKKMWHSYDCSKIKQILANADVRNINEQKNGMNVFTKIGGSFSISE